MAYNVNPQPLSGTNAYGYIPGPLDLPDPYGDLSKAFPALGQANKLAGGDIVSELGGNVSPGTRNALKLASAQFGNQSGMGPSGLSDNQLFGNIAGFAEGQVQKGMQNYNQLIPTVSGTQTVNPALQTEIANRNATFSAAPDPTQANNLAQQLFNQYMQNMRGPAGGTGGGTDLGSPSGGTGPAQWRTDAYNAFWNPQNPSSGVGGGAIGPPEPLVPDSSYPDFGSTLGIPNDAWNNTMFDF